MSWKPGKWRNKAITGAQRSFIEDITKELQQPFTGDNRGKASDYIDATIADFRDSKQKKREGRAPKEKPTIVKLKEKKGNLNVIELHSKNEEKALKLYHAYQYEFLEQHNISIRDIIEMVESRQSGHRIRFHKELSAMDAYDNIVKNGTGFPAEEMWIDYEQFCNQYIYSFDERIFDIIAGMHISEKEKIELGDWILEIRRQNNTEDISDECSDDADDVDDDWLGPHPEETWSDLYEKD